MRRIVGVGLLVLCAGCVTKGRFAAKEREVDACFRALEQDNRRKKELAEATAQLHARLDELSTLLSKAESKSAEVEALRLRLQEAADQVSELQQEQQKLRARSDTYDRLVATLRQEIEAGKVKVREGSNRLSVEMTDKVLFDSGSASLNADGEHALRKVGAVLRTVGDRQIVVEGHTDSAPIGGGLAERFPTNWELSAARATCVVRFLEDAGVDPARLAAAGYSRYRPVADNATDDGRRQNRRIEIVLTP